MHFIILFNILKYWKTAMSSHGEIITLSVNSLLKLTIMQELKLWLCEIFNNLENFNMKNVKWKK